MSNTPRLDRMIRSVNKVRDESKPQGDSFTEGFQEFINNSEAVGNETLNMFLTAQEEGNELTELELYNFYVDAQTNMALNAVMINFDYYSRLDNDSDVQRRNISSAAGIQ